MRQIARLLVFLCLLVSAPVTVVPFQQRLEKAKAPQVIESALQIGTITLRVGMPKGAVIPALALQYDVIAQPPPTTSPSLTPNREYRITLKTKNAPSENVLVGNLYFDAQEKLVAVERYRVQGGSGGDTADAIIALFGGLILEGKTSCSIDVSQFGPKLRDALILCSDKRIRISSASGGYAEVIEEIGSPVRAFE